MIAQVAVIVFSSVFFNDLKAHWDNMENLNGIDIIHILINVCNKHVLILIIFPYFVRGNEENMSDKNEFIEGN